jgi:glycosyltransferase involved in cell wall biosynthesis
VVIVRGHQANPWELRPWEQPPLAERFAVEYVRSRRGWFDTRSLALQSRTALTMRDLLPPGRLGDLAVRVPGDRYLAPARALRGADIVHAQELGYWYSMQAARLKPRLGFKLVLTVWETIPLLDAYRNVRTRGYRRATLAAADLFLAATERARTALLLEGAPAERIRVCPPGVALERFAAARTRAAQEAAGRPGAEPRTPVIVSPGRLVWEKGHQDVLRAFALLRREHGDEGALGARVLIVGSGPEEQRLRAYAHELGIADAVEFAGFIPYEQMPALYAHAACIVLASLPTWSWEEQFGMVLAEAMAAGAPILASSSGAIPEVAGARARYFVPGDWPALATLLRDVLAHASVEDEAGSGAGAQAREGPSYSLEVTAECLAEAYAELLGAPAGVAPSSSAS